MGDKMNLDGLVADIGKATAVSNGVVVLIEGICNHLNDVAGEFEGKEDNGAGAQAKEVSRLLKARSHEIANKISGMNRLVDGVTVIGRNTIEDREAEDARATKAAAKK